MSFFTVPIVLVWCVAPIHGDNADAVLAQLAMGHEHGGVSAHNPRHSHGHESIYPGEFRSTVFTIPFALLS